MFPENSEWEPRRNQTKDGVVQSVCCWWYKPSSSSLDYGFVLIIIIPILIIRLLTRAGGRLVSSLQQLTAHMTTAGRGPKNDNEEQVERRSRSWWWSWSWPWWSKNDKLWRKWWSCVLGRSDNDWGIARRRRRIAKCGIITLTTSHLPHHHHISQSVSSRLIQTCLVWVIGETVPSIFLWCCANRMISRTNRSNSPENRHEFVLPSSLLMTAKFGRCETFRCW